MKSKDPSTLEKCKALREQYEETMENEQVKAIVLTLKESHKDKDINQVLDLHNLTTKEVRLVLQYQLPNIEQKLINGEIQPNTQEGHVYCIVTGKGNHGKKSVLKPLVERHLLKEGFTYTELENGAGFKIIYQ